MNKTDLLSAIEDFFEFRNDSGLMRLIDKANKKFQCELLFRD